MHSGHGGRVGRRRSVVAATLIGLATASAIAQQPPTARVLRPAASSIVLEIEDLAGALAVSGGDSVVQPMAGFGPGWGGDAQLFWRPPGTGPTLSFDLQVPAAGTWDLALQYTTAPDYGRFAVRVAGREVGEIDGYATSVAVARRNLGQHTLAAGTHPVVLSVTGRHPNSTGWIVGLDRVEATLVTSAAPEAPPAATLRRSAAFDAPRAPGQPLFAPEMLRTLGQEVLRPRLEAKSWGVAGRSGIEVRWEPRRLRLDWDRPNLEVGFRWLAPGGSTGGRWQIFDDVPPPIGKAQPIASGPLPATAAGQWQEFTRDLAPFKPVDPLRGLPWSSPASALAKLRPRLFLQVQASGANEPSNFIEVKFSNEVVGKLKTPDPQLTIALVDYSPTRPYDERFLCWAVATKDGPPKGAFDPNNPKAPMWRQGDKRGDLCDHDDSGGIVGFFEDFGSALAGAVMSFIDSLGAVVDQASAVYAKAKQGVLDLAVAPLKSLGCGSPCEQAMAFALDAALVSVGVPPSLPDFAQVVQDLEDGGIDVVTDALVGTAVSQGLPADQIPGAREAARAAVAHLVDEAKKQTSGGGAKSSGDSGWGPDLSRAYSPAVLVFEVRNRGTARSQPTFVQLLHDNPRRTEVSLPIWQKLPVGGYGPTWTPVAALEPGTATRVAVTLTPESDPHLWLELYYGRSSLLPPQEWCRRDYGQDPQTLTACEARMRVRSQMMFSNAFELNRAWNEIYGKGSDTFSLRLLRYSEGGAFEGVAGSLTCDRGGPCRVAYEAPTWLGRRLDACLAAGGTCGEPVAHEFCRRQGYAGASGAQGANGLGPTLRLGDGGACASGCAGFSNITCSTS